MDWLEISLTVDAELAEAVADVLNRFAPGGVAIEAHADGLSLEAGPVTVKAYLPAGPNTPHMQRQVEEALWHLSQIEPLPEPVFTPVAEADWADAWKEHFQPLRIGRRIVIKPTWRAFQARPSDIVIELDPGMAFGTGLHPTTQMCLQVLEDAVQPAMHILDLGTGSGILAIAAAKLGAAEVLALDVDPVAVKVAQENADRNGVADRVTVAQGSIDRTASAHDFVVVNILANVIIALAENELAKRIHPGGGWVAAGIIESQVADVAAALEGAGLRVTARRQVSDWVTLIGYKPKEG